MALRRSNTRPAPATLTAAATRIKLADPKIARGQAAKRQEWQADAWAYFDEVPEIKEAVRYRGNQVAKVRLYAAVANPDDPDGAPIPVDAEGSGVPPAVAQAAQAELARLRGQVGGATEILRELDMNLEVAGECYLVGFGARVEEVRQSDGSYQSYVRGEDWQIRSVSEVEVKGAGASTRFFVKDRPDQQHPRQLDPDLDTIIRIWTRHPQWSDLPDSAMRGLLGDCRILQVLSQQVLAEANSRQSAGIFTIPNDLDFGPADPTAPEDGRDPDGDSDFEAELLYALSEPIADPSAASSVMPLVLRGPPESLKPDVLRHITLGRDTNDALEKRIEARVVRIARGLNLPVEKIMGHQETTYANAAQVDEDEYNDYLRPSVDTVTDALTWAFLRPQLEEAPQVPPDWSGRIFVAADNAALIRDPDVEANANDLFDRFAIGFDAYRRFKGADEGDAPDPTEMLVMAGLRRGILTADLTKALLELLGVDIAVEALPAAGDATDEADALAGALRAAAAADPDRVDPALLDAVLARLAAPPVPVAATRLPAPALAAGGGARPLGARLVDVDRELRTRLQVACNDAMTRALERAGNRLRSATNGTQYRAVVARVAPTHAFAQLGPALAGEVLGDDDPLAGAWDDLERQFMAWGASAQADAVTAASVAVSGFTPDARNALGLRQADDLAEAWAWMRQAMTGLAWARLLDPDPAAPPFGEFDPTLKVPAGLVRQGMARAGGARDLLDLGDGTWVSVRSGGQQPAGGIATGAHITDVLRDGGARIEAYRWVYGPAFRQRPYEPHLRLDGTVFENFDDAALENPGTWPPFSHYMPGDHAGCICDFEPIVIAAEQVA